MMDNAAAPVAVEIWGMWQGHEIAGSGRVMLDDTGGGVRVEMSPPGPRFQMSLAELDGARLGPDQVILYPRSGDVVEMTGGPGRVVHLAELGRRLVAAACELPELTVPLRGLGSARGQPGPDHDRFFAPFLAARRAAARSDEPVGRLVAVDPAALDASVRRVVAELAVARYPKLPPERRALEAELSDLAEPVVASLRALAEAARRARTAEDDVRFVRWREWAAAVRAVFVAADRCWLAMLPVLAQAPVPR
jgi:hypothetical protein